MKERKNKIYHNKPHVWESLGLNFGWILANDTVTK
jgi:hypothetical protein